MHRGSRGLFVILVLTLAACRRKPPPGPPPLLRCDSVDQLLTGPHHICTEVRDPKIVESQRAWWQHLNNSRITTVCTENESCPLDEKRGGCLMPNGAVEWNYSEDVDQIRARCSRGRFVGAGETLPATTSMTFRCARDATCDEMTSGIDLIPTVEAQNCAVTSGKFEAGPCSVASVVGRCQFHNVDMETVRLYDARTFDAERAKRACALSEGSFVP